jgi:trimeric autotransporter adhesin
MKTVTNCINRSPLRCGFFTLAIALCWLALSPLLKAQCPSACGSGGNTAVGVNALDSVTTGINNTAVGSNALTDDTTGAYNVAVGSGALANNTTGQQNMAVGAEALLNNNGNFNLAIGFRTGYLNTTGSRLTGIGAAALRNNTTASDNTAIGATALRENSSGEQNTAVGSSALANNLAGGDNTAIGAGALFSNTADGNTAVGTDALSSNVGGVSNVAVGRDALQDNTGGSENTAVGVAALAGVTTGGFNTAIGGIAGANITTGQFNTIIGDIAGLFVTTASNTICIGGSGINVSNTCQIGHIRGVTTVNNNAIPVLIDSAGQLGTLSSSARFKKDIKPMDTASEVVLALKPVTFHYKSDCEQRPEYGLIAEEVAKVNPNLVVRDDDGEIYTVRYEAVNAMLLNEFLKEHKKVEEQQASIAQLKSTVALQQKGMEVLTAQLKEQAAQIQRVSAQLEVSKPAPKVVTNR